MKNLSMSDEETVMVYLSIRMLEDDVKENAPGFMATLNKIRMKIEKHIEANPIILDGLIKLINSDSEFANHPQAAKLLNLLKHVVAASKIMEDIKGETEECNLCDGAGKFTSGSGLPCPRCGGSGKLNKKETYN